MVRSTVFVSQGTSRRKMNSFIATAEVCYKELTPVACYKKELLGQTNDGLAFDIVDTNTIISTLRAAYPVTIIWKSAKSRCISKMLKSQLAWLFSLSYNIFHLAVALAESVQRTMKLWISCWSSSQLK